MLNEKMDENPKNIDDKSSNRQIANPFKEEGKLPIFLKSIIECYPNKDKKMILLSCITVISSVLPKVKGKYHHQIIYPNLYLYIIGKAGSGKGEVNRTRKLITLIENGVQPEDSELNLLEQAITYSKNTKHGNPIMIPANSSASGFTKLFEERQGNGLVFETEGDTLANIFKTDYGNWSDMLRKAFHHETISQYRKTDDEHLVIEEPKLSVLVTSTPNQLGGIVKSAENGLFSRFMYWYTEPTDTFLDVFSVKGNNRDKVFKESASLLYQLYQKLQGSEELEICLSENQKVQFLEYFGMAKSQLTNLIHTDLEGTVNRIAISMFRIIMVLTTIRNMDNEYSELLQCCDDDFDLALEIAGGLLINAQNAMEILPNQDHDEMSDHKRSLFIALPNEFTTAEAKKLARKYNVADRMVDRFIKTDCFTKVKHGTYRKAS